MTTVIRGTDDSASTPALTGTDADTGVFFPAANTMAMSTGGSERMRVDASGNVGIGTSSPQDKLHVVASAVAGTTYNSDDHFVVENNGTCNINLISNTTGANFLLFSDTTRARGSVGYDHTDDFMRLSTAGTERMRITSAGNLLVGTTSTTPGYFNAINGLAINNAGAITASSAGGWDLGNTGASGGAVINFGTTTNWNTGSISVTTSATAFNTSSDYRLKENVAPMAGALAKVLELNPVTYTWKANGSDGQGFIAHELQAICPEAVTGEKDATEIRQVEASPAVPAIYDEDGNELTPAVEAVYEEREVPKYQGVDSSFLVATLTAAIQELKTIVDAQAARIAALEAQ